MALLKIEQEQHKYLAVATVAALLIGVWFLRDFVLLILLAVVAAVLFNPVYKWLLRTGRKPNTAAGLTFLVAVLVVLLPLILVTAITVLQIEGLVTTLSHGSYSQSLYNFSNTFIDTINRILADIGLSYRLTIGTVANTISVAAEHFSKALVNGLLSSVSGFFAFLTAIIIYIYVFISIMIHQEKLISTVKKLNPLGDTVSELYLERIHAMTKATVRGQFVIAFCQGAVSAGVLALTGMSNLFFFFLMLLSVLSIIPLGAGIVTIPIGAVMILTGNVWQGVTVIAAHLLIVTNIDNVLRPQLVPATAKLDPALMILAVFAGLGMFGFFGIILGPVLMIILTTTVQIYLEVFKGTASIDHTKPVKKRRLLGLFGNKSKV